MALTSWRTWLTSPARRETEPLPGPASAPMRSVTAKREGSRGRGQGGPIGGGNRAVGDGLHERLVVSLVLIGISSGEASEGLGKSVAAAHVRADGDPVAGSGVAAGQ